jgi:uncharacterized protein (DUF342 family)
MIVEIADKKMKAYITFEAPIDEGDLLRRDQILSEIKKNNIVAGIDDSLLDFLMEDRVHGKKYLIASGDEPTVGDHGFNTMMFDTSASTLKPKLLEDGTVDYKNLDNVKMAYRGDVLARVTKPTIGEDGFDVTGEVLPGREGKPAPRMPKGKGTRISDCGNELIAEITGKLIIIDGKVNVSEVYEVEQDVGPNTGNINFNGSVIVRGNVMTDFSIKATGNVEIFGVVEGAEIYSGGNIWVSRGITGMSKAYLQANGDISAKTIQNANLEAGGCIYAETIMHSTAKAKGSIELGGKKALLVGGDVHAYRGIDARIVGSTMGTSTNVHIGSDQNYLQEYNEKLSEYANLKLKYQENLYFLNSMVKKNQVDIAQKEIRTSLLNTINATRTLKGQMANVKAKIKHLKELVDTDNTRSVLVVHDVVYPGVTIRIGNAVYNVENEQYRSRFRNHTGLVTVSPI